MVRAGMGWFQTTRSSKDLGLCTTPHLVPANRDTVEIIIVEVENASTVPWHLPPMRHPFLVALQTTCRDHRQVTSMFNETAIHKHGVIVKARIQHDEHGHRPNKVSYGVLGCQDTGTAPKAIWSNIHQFIGEGGSLDNPEVVYKNLPHEKISTGDPKDGVESIGAFRFAPVKLAKGEKRSFVIIRAITENRTEFLTNG